MIEAYGDSTTVGCTITVNAVATEACPVDGYATASMTEPAALQQLLQSSLGPTVTVSNKGVSGTTTGDLLNGTGRQNGQTWQASMSASKAQIVTVNFGLNDAWLPSENFTANLQNIISIARAAGKTIVLFTPNPLKTPNATVNANLIAFREQEIQTAQSMGVTVVDDYSQLPQAQWSALLPDGTHPTAQGYLAKAEAEAYVLGPIVRSMM
ncbi:SGNH/GDSL hydrolase family protein [Burkholderia pseudomallei]|uniref:SGNH/GDSL hydrolase family protein n=1 Tax=Burkholderia pseudomallei TaxID=28450 RepID=UPI000A1A267B|nr:SGNH/GDSL hydrolase family protein [Burkholderia pseudomallei]ARK86031.1 hypothetical protein BOC42_00225 [Burkholderia pseudomallei]